MPAALRSRLRRHCACFSTLQIAETHLECAKQLLSTQKKEDVESALSALETALEQCPRWEKALELKARTLLTLHRFKDVVQLLHEYVPSLMPPHPRPPPVPSLTCRLATAAFTTPPESPISKERTRLLASYDFDRDEILLLSPLNYGSSVAKLRKKLFARLCYKKLGRQQHWRYTVLGQACCHLGMLEDAMLLLQIGKKTASAVSRRKSNGLREDKFCTDAADVAVIGHYRNAAMAADSDAVAQMLSNIKFLLRRRTAALAALQAGHYAEAARHFTKIIDGRKGSPQGFIADCYLHRAIAYQATGRVVDAIADCNRTLALNSHCTKALSLRASLYEMVRCYSECLLDLQQLKMQYDVSLRYQMFPEPRTWTIRQQCASDVDLAGGLDYVNSKITALRQKLSDVCSLDAFTILDMPRSCTMVDVKRAYLLLSLKHRPDTATQFLDRCELVDDDRDMETVREEVRASALRLSQLIHKGYLEILSCLAEEKELERQSKSSESSVKETSERSEAPVIQLDESPRGKDEERCSSRDAWGIEGDGSACSHGRATGESRGASLSSTTTESVVLEAFTGFNLYGATSEEEEASSSMFYEESRGAAAEDSCDFCQPFGGFTTTALASALSQALLHDLPIAAMATPPWTPDWSHTIAQPLHVT